MDFVDDVHNVGRAKAIVERKNDIHNIQKVTKCCCFDVLFLQSVQLERRNFSCKGSSVITQARGKTAAIRFNSILARYVSRDSSIVSSK